MIPKIISADYVHDYTIHIVFNDGTAGDVDLEEELWGEVFEPLLDRAEFRAFKLDTELNTVTWPSGADFAPEFLYDRAVSAAGQPSSGG